MIVFIKYHDWCNYQIISRNFTRFMLSLGVFTFCTTLSTGEFMSTFTQYFVWVSSRIVATDIHWNSHSHLFHCMNAKYASFDSRQFFVIWIIQIVLTCYFHRQSYNVFNSLISPDSHVTCFTPMTVMWHVPLTNIPWQSCDMFQPHDSHVTCSTLWQSCDIFHPLTIMWLVPPSRSHVTCSIPWQSCDLSHTHLRRRVPNPTPLLLLRLKWHGKVEHG